MIHLSNVTKRQGQRILYENAGFTVRPGEKIGLVGPNGAGKTTIFRLICAEDQPDGGTISVMPDTVIGYFSQDVGDLRGRSVLEEVMAGAGRVYDLAVIIQEAEKRLAECEEHPLSDDEMDRLMTRYGDAQMEYQQRGGYDLEARAKAILTGLGIPPEDHHRPVESYSGGWKMRVALARILALNPDVLLMDEPTNHLDIESILWLEEWLRNFPGAVVMTSHDREFMNRLVSRIVEIANQTITPYSGDYDFYLREREVRREQLLAAHRRQQEMLAKEEDFIARFAARASHAAQVQSRIKKLDKIERIEIPAETKTIHFEFPEPPRSGNDVVRLHELSKTWTRDDGREIKVFSGVTGTVQRLDKIAVTGVNGAGKSTLLKSIVGQTDPTSGSLVIGASVKIGYFSQSALDVLDPKATIFEEMLRRFPEASVGFIRNLLGAFLFSGDDADKRIGVLSGGEKSRVVLATILASPVNFLVLDEPTNHLDIESRETLLRAVQEFKGTVMVVSHDRHFLRQIVTRVFEIRSGELRTYEGNYDYYLEKKAQDSLNL
jgi:ATP-binding cassette subfamily F protein 3